MLGTVTVSSLLMVFSLLPGSSSSQTLQELTRIDPLAVNQSGLFTLVGLPPSDLPATGKGSIKKTGETYELFVNPLKFNDGLVSPLAPIRTEGGTATLSGERLSITGATLKFGGVKPSACKIPGLEIRSSLCGAKITNAVVDVNSSFQSGQNLDFSLKPAPLSPSPSEQTLLVFTDEVTQPCEDLATQPGVVVNGQPTCTINLSVVLARGGNIFAGSGKVK